jgi:hypothetical protein
MSRQEAAPLNGKRFLVLLSPGLISAFMFPLFRALGGSATTARNHAATLPGGSTSVLVLGLADEGRAFSEREDDEQTSWPTEQNREMNRPWSRAGSAQWVAPMLLDLFSDPN